MPHTDQYTDEEKNTIIRLHDAGHSCAEIAEAIGRSEGGVASYARRLRTLGEWPDNVNALRELPTNKPGRPPNRDRPRTVGARLSEDVASAMVAVSDFNSIGRNEFIVDALWLLAERDGVAQAEDRYALQCPSGKKKLNASPRSKQTSTQIPESDFVLAKKLADEQGKKVGTIVAAAVHLMLQELGYTLEGANV